MQTFLIFVGLIMIVRCFGPITHALFTCQATSDDVKRCLCGTDGNNKGRDDDLLLGLIAPDAFFFTPNFVFGSKCKNTPALHDLIFAGYMLQFSIINPVPGFNASSFSVGYATHIAADYPAFQNAHSYLSSKFPNWLNVWSTMKTLDSYVYRAQGSCMAKIPSSISNLAAQYISDATAFYNANNPDFPIITVDEITECFNDWGTLVNDNLRSATLTQRATNENELVINDPYQATTLNQALQNFESVKNCSIASISHWLKLATASCASPREAQRDLVKFIDQMISDGKCQPKGLTNIGKPKYNHVC